MHHCIEWYSMNFHPIAILALSWFHSSHIQKTARLEIPNSQHWKTPKKVSCDEKRKAQMSHASSLMLGLGAPLACSSRSRTSEHKLTILAVRRVNESSTGRSSAQDMFYLKLIKTPGVKGRFHNLRWRGITWDHVRVMTIWIDMKGRENEVKLGEIQMQWHEMARGAMIWSLQMNWDSVGSHQVTWCDDLHDMSWGEATSRNAMTSNW